MVPNPDEPYPPFSTDGQRRFDELLVRLGRLIAERARGEARAGRANFVSDEHVDLVGEALLPREAPSTGPVRAGVPGLLVSSILAIAGTALLAGIQDWRWANFGVAVLLVTVVVVLLRRPTS